MIPAAASALGRVVRLHEHLHLVKPLKPVPRKFNVPAGISGDDVQLTVNHLSDCVAHSSLRWKELPRSVRRDWLSVAVRDARRAAPYLSKSGVAHGKAVTPRQFNSALVVLLRALNIGDSLRTSSSDADEREKITGIFQKIVSPVGTVPSSFYSVPRPTAKSHRRFVEDILKAMRPDIPIPDHPEPQKVPGKDDDDGHGSKIPKMEIVELPRRVPCSSANSPKKFHSESGGRLDRRQLVRIATGRPTPRPFIRVRRAPGGGTWLLDASGSMEISAAGLVELCSRIPAAQVGIYAGENPSVGGKLVIVAKNGFRADARTISFELETLGGNNVVDLPALRWLFDQPGPHVLVSDLQFCGAGAEVSAAAVRLANESRRRGKLTVHLSYRDAMDSL
jgi:hypothetical protein